MTFWTSYHVSGRKETNDFMVMTYVRSKVNSPISDTSRPAENTRVITTISEIER